MWVHSWVFMSWELEENKVLLEYSLYLFRMCREKTKTTLEENMNVFNPIKHMRQGCTSASCGQNERKKKCSAKTRFHTCKNKSSECFFFFFFYVLSFTRFFPIYFYIRKKKPFPPKPRFNNPKTNLLNFFFFFFYSWTQFHQMFSHSCSHKEKIISLKKKNVLEKKMYSGSHI